MQSNGLYLLWIFLVFALKHQEFKFKIKIQNTIKSTDEKREKKNGHKSKHLPWMESLKKIP